jgi:hypothetical protein
LVESGEEMTSWMDVGWMLVDVGWMLDGCWWPVLVESGEEMTSWIAEESKGNLVVKQG